MLYDRKIRYIDYMENGERIKNAGFVRLERRNDQCRLLVQVTGLQLRGQLEGQAVLLGEDCEASELPDRIWLGKILLVQGKGSLEKEMTCREMAEMGIVYEQLWRISIPLGFGKELRCNISAGKESDEMTKVSENKAELTETEEDVSEKKRKVRGEQDKENEPREGEKREETEELTETEEDVSEKKREARGEQDKENEPREGEETGMEMAPTKWKQLEQIYRHSRPFGDEREYLVIGPGDFVLFSEKDYHLTANSFLLHGYYNYGHLILVKWEKRGSRRYYVGVPGNFYEREKQVALMFGFESFECRKEPAQNGDFGYYMIPVGL